MRRVDPSGGKGPIVPVAAIEGARASGYPRLALHGSEIVFAWTETAGGTPVVKTAAAPVEPGPATRR
jgi:hypothetical protein